MEGLICSGSIGSIDYTISNLVISGFKLGGASIAPFKAQGLAFSMYAFLYDPISMHLSYTLAEVKSRGRNEFQMALGAQTFPSRFGQWER